MRNSRVPVRETSRSRRGAAVVNSGSSLAGRSLSKSPQGFVTMQWDHELQTYRTVPLTGCCRRLVGRALLRFLCRQDAGSTLRFMDSPHDFAAVHWEHESTPIPSRAGNWHDANQCFLLPSWAGSGGVGQFMELHRCRPAAPRPCRSSAEHWVTRAEWIFRMAQCIRAMDAMAGALYGA